jgi:hypothetical protein
MFRKGDKVMFVKDGVIGWESSRYYLVDKLNYNTTYIIEEYDRGCECVLLKDHSLWHHPDHFKLVDEHDQYVVKLTQDEVDALVLVTGSLYGDTTYSMRVYTSYIFDYIYDMLDIVSVDITSNQPTSTFGFKVY